MEKLASQPGHSSDVRSAVDSLRHDFDELVSIFEQQLISDVQLDSDTRVHLAEAKMAAERGLRLTGDLVQLIGRVA